MKRVFKILGINAAIFIALLFVLELSLAAFLGPVYLRSDPTWIADGHTKGRIRPNSTIEGAGGHNVLNPIQRETVARYQLNSLGFRGPDWDFAAPYSNVFLGASSTFNFHDSDDAIWPFLVNGCLQSQQNRDYQYVNLSQPGYSVENAPHLYIQIAQHLNPRNIFVYHAWNDLKLVSRLASDRNRRFFSGVSRNQWSIKNALLDLGLFPNIIQRANIFFRSNLATENYYADSKVSEEDIAFAIDFLRRQYEVLIDLAGEDRQIYLIKQGVNIDGEGLPPKDAVIGRLQRMTKAQFQSALTAYFSMLDDLAEDHTQVRVIDAQSMLPKTEDIFEDHVHLQTKGNRLLAEVICSNL
ncbi:hypothetical protein [Pelagibius sp.]|uniref:hypothetical protein n=1 Tax=Pelagibius sp. TaxID=1931238 RepID=UPI003B50DBD5